MLTRTAVFVFLLLHEFSLSEQDRKVTPEEELKEIEKLVNGMANMEFHESGGKDGMFEEEIDEIMLDGLQNHEHEEIVRKMFDSEKVETTEDKNVDTGDKRGDPEDHDNKATRNGITVEQNLAGMPHFYGEMVEVTKKTFTIKLSHDTLPSGIPFYEFVVLRLNTDSEGYPRLPREDSHSWQTFIPYTKEPTPGHPYIAARFAREDLPRKFTVGDNLHYGGSFNGQLTPGSFFVLFLRGTVRDGNALSHRISNYISTLTEPDTANFFHTEMEPKSKITKFGIGLLAGIILTTVILLELVRRRKYKNYKRARVSDEDSEYSENEEISVIRSLSSCEKRKKSAQHNSIEEKIQNAPKVVTKNEEKTSSSKSTKDTETVKKIPSKSVNSKKGSSNKNSTVKGKEDAKKEKSDSKNQRKREQKHNDSQIKEEDPSITRDRILDLLYTNMSITSSNAPKSSKSKDNENGKETKDSNENKKKDRKINGGSKSFDELEDEGESDSETGSIDVGGYGTKRDGRNEKDYRAALKRRMVAYRWLITVKQTRKISADVDIKLILAGKVVLPEEILRDKPKNIDFERLKWDTIAFEENEINKTGAELLENL